MIFEGCVRAFAGGLACEGGMVGCVGLSLKFLYPS